MMAHLFSLSHPRGGRDTSLCAPEFCIVPKWTAAANAGI
jgi:hypothetical protein